MDFYAAILAGGSGERFWPLSTPERPKQFLDVFGGRSLIRQAVDRLAGLVPPERIIVVTAAALVEATRSELPEVPKANIAGEPMRRDTGAAVAVACAMAARRGGDGAVVAILTADQLMKDVPAFRQVLSDAAIAASKTDSIVTMGVKPTYPATGFGYIEAGEALDFGTATAFRKAKRFVEKPDAAKAAEYLANGGYVWNAGMFVWRVSTMKEALKIERPLADLESLLESCDDIGPALEREYPGLRRISIDYAVMERFGGIIVGSGDFGWDDVGTWAAADKHLPSDEKGNVLKGDATELDCEGIVAIESGGPRIAAMGLKDVVVVSTAHGILVAAKNRVEDMKKLLAKMEKPQ